jgi:hypothetical protein
MSELLTEWASSVCTESNDARHSKDVHYGIRPLLYSMPCGDALITVALGVGATTATFSVVDAAKRLRKKPLRLREWLESN